jgi:hypothetical protein
MDPSTYSTYPITNSLFTNTQKVKTKDGTLKPLVSTITTKKSNNCFPTQGYKESCQPDVMYGYHKPLNESCTAITGQINNSPDNICSSPWNNMTKRKSLVKDY